MPYKSKAQQRYLESKASPLTQAQKEEFRAATDFKSLPEKVSAKARPMHGDGKQHWTGR
jgi:hypothetical protein